MNRRYKNTTTTGGPCFGQRRLKKFHASEPSPQITTFLYVYDFLRNLFATQGENHPFSFGDRQNRPCSTLHSSVVWYSYDTSRHPADADGNISEYIKLVDGSVIAHQEYDAFGNVIAFTGTKPCSFGFSTKYADEETGLVYYGFRYYSPELGRWLNRDPIGEGGGINVYSYLNNSALTSIEYIGLSCYNGPEKVNWNVGNLLSAFFERQSSINSFAQGIKNGLLKFKLDCGTCNKNPNGYSVCSKYEREWERRVDWVRTGIRELESQFAAYFYKARILRYTPAAGAATGTPFPNLVIIMRGTPEYRAIRKAEKLDKTKAYLNLAIETAKKYSETCCCGED